VSKFLGPRDVQLRRVLHPVQRYQTYAVTELRAAEPVSNRITALIRLDQDKDLFDALKTTRPLLLLPSGSAWQSDRRKMMPPQRLRIRLAFDHADVTTLASSLQPPKPIKKWLISSSPTKTQVPVHRMTGAHGHDLALFIHVRDANYGRSRAINLPDSELAQEFDREFLGFGVFVEREPLACPPLRSVPGVGVMRIVIAMMMMIAATMTVMRLTVVMRLMVLGAKEVGYFQLKGRNNVIGSAASMAFQ
jgi:hypothetical protein